MSCRFILFDLTRPSDEWVPMALREATCRRRESDPARWNGELREHGVAVAEDDCLCLQNLAGTWDACPLYQERT